MASSTTPTSKTAVADGSSGKSKKSNKQRVPSEERYDLSREQGVDPRDPRAQGYPCYGQHVPMPPGRGSLSGANKFGRWMVCEKCRVRISYTPTYGSTGHYRQAGPLPADTQTVLEKIGTQVETNHEAREKLNAKNASIIGAEESLREKLKKLENERAKIEPKNRPQNTQTVTEDSKKAARPSEKTSEQVEAESWEKVNS